ncbi:hypothetical protein HJG60_009610 [Phyllostomus discolor]|uniref:Uncharacterized protein n=1 Tax=Phyllostomus discolor TaxID=89673 RepID=A0A833YFW6_9CHIR|nr:hypothetical protein HJG60_009610 [Phyllostomus discolor]
MGRTADSALCHPWAEGSRWGGPACLGFPAVESQGRVSGHGDSRLELRCQPGGPAESSRRRGPPRLAPPGRHVCSHLSQAALSATADIDRGPGGSLTCRNASLGTHMPTMGLIERNSTSGPPKGPRELSRCLCVTVSAYSGFPEAARRRQTLGVEKRAGRYLQRSWWPESACWRPESQFPPGTQGVMCHRGCVTAEEPEVMEADSFVVEMSAPHLAPEGDPFLKTDLMCLFLGREGRKKEKERSISVQLPLTPPPLGT